MEFDGAGRRGVYARFLRDVIVYQVAGNCTMRFGQVPFRLHIASPSHEPLSVATTY